MMKSGPEKLFKTKLSLSQALRALGEFNAENEKRIDSLCELSVASMDIESRTVELDLSPPNNACIGSEPSPAYVKKIQKPVMIAHQDSLSGVITFQAEDNSEEAIYSMMSLYWKKILELKLECVKAKKKEAEPLYEIFARYEKSLFELGDKFSSKPEKTNEDTSEFLTDSNLAKFWRASLPGQACRRLDQLVNDYQVFSFYG
jgi:hypothetical protein